MSGQQIGTVVGGIIGAYFGNAQLGMAIGGLVGGYVDPTKIKGPHIGQGQTQTSTTGVPIAWVQGTAKIAGTLIAVGPRREVKVSSGKGSSTVNINYEARQDFAILICESSELKDSTIKTVLMVEQDGKIVYDVRPGSKYQAASMKWASNVDFMFGAEDQMPHPTLEAIYGVGSTPAYRGRCIAVFKDFNVTAAGDRIPSFMFTVASVATSQPVDNVLAEHEVALFINGSTNAHDQDNLWFSTYDESIKADTGDVAIGDMLLEDGGLAPPFWAWGQVALKAMAYCKETTTPQYANSFDSAAKVETVLGISGMTDYATGWQYYYGPPTPDFVNTWFTDHGLNGPVTLGNGVTGLPFVISTDVNTAEGIRYFQFQYPGAFDGDSYNPTIKVALTGGRPLVRAFYPYWVDTDDGTLWRPSWATPSGMNEWTEGSVGLDVMVSRICKRGGLLDSDIDVTALAGTFVGGYPIATQCTGDEALQPLLQSYFAFGTECDGKLIFKFYGENASVTVARDELVLNDATEGAISMTRRNQATEFPQKVTAQFIDPAQNYNTNTQTAERLASTVIAIGETTVQMPVVMSADDAAKAADKALKVAYATLEGTQNYSTPFATPNADYLTLCSGEPLFMDGKRWVIDELTIGNMYLKLSTRYDRQSAYTSNVQAIPANPPPLPVSKYSGPTDLLPMNLPSLRPQDTYGVYLAAKGFDESNWRGCTVQVSYDGQVSWQNALTITVASIMGRLAQDETDPTTLVDIGSVDALESVSTAQLDAQANAFALVDSAGIAEIRQFQTATMEAATGSTPVEWLLSDQRTGLLGTTHKEYVANDRFTMLQSVYFLPIDLSFSGNTIYFRAVGFGEIAEDAVIVPFVYQPDTTVIIDGGVVTP